MSATQKEINKSQINKNKASTYESQLRLPDDNAPTNLNLLSTKNHCHLYEKYFKFKSLIMIRCSVGEIVTHSQKY